MEKILKLLEYNFWANDQFIVRLQEHNDLPPKIPELMSHLLSAHRVWLDRIYNRTVSLAIWDSIDKDRWEEMNIELFQDSGNLVKSRDLNQTVRYATSTGELFENSLEDLLYHLINHSTHHRAQIAILMRQGKILPPPSDYIFYLRK